MQKSSKIIALILSFFALGIVLYFVSTAAFGKKNEDSLFTIMTYMADVQVLDKYEKDEQYYADIQILSEDVLQEYKLAQDTMTLKLDDNIFDEVKLNQETPYIGISIQLEVNAKDVTEEQFASLQQHPDFAWSKEEFHENLTISRLSSGANNSDN